MREGAKEGYSRKKNKSKNKKIYFIIFVMLIITFIVTSVISIKWLIATNKSKSVNKEIISRVTKTKNESTKENYSLEIDFNKLLEINNQVVGWIKIEDTDINYPIVKGEDNSYYLNHNILNESSQNGWIFMDYRNSDDFSDNNTVLYGHNIKSGIMFSDLTKIYNGKANKDIIVYLKNGNIYRYAIYSCYMSEPDDISINTNVKDSTLTDYMNQMKNRSVRQYNVNIVLNDNITLSTCDSSGKKRIIVHGIKQNKKDDIVYEKLQ